MRKILFPLAAGLLFSAIAPVRATMIVYGTLSGTIVATNSYFYFPGTIGMSVTGRFGYDYDLLSPPDASGLRTVAYNDANSFFSIEASDGINAGGGGGYGLSSLVVDCNGLPYSGMVASTPDLSIRPGGYVYMTYPVGRTAQVTYTITGVPDGNATWFLLGLGLAGATFIRHVWRQKQL